jgi:O-antigen/teichoic acid export membrane protein
MISLWKRVRDISPFGNILFFSTITNFLLGGLFASSGILAARILGAEGRGELAAIQTFSSFLGGLALLGTSEAIVYFCSREPGKSGQWFMTSVVITSMTWIPLIIAGSLLMPWLLNAQEKNIIEAAQFYLWNIPFYALVALSHQVLRGKNDLVFWNFIRLLPSLTLLITFLLIIIRELSDPVIVSKLYLFLIVFFCFPISYAIIWFRVPKPFIPSLSMSKPLVMYGIPTLLSRFPEQINLRLDQMVMASLLAPKLLGLYVAAVTWSVIIKMPLQALGAILQPRIGKTQQVDQSSIVSKGLRLGLFLSVLTTIPVIIVTPAVFPMVFGQDFKVALPAAIILCIAAGVEAFNQVLRSSAFGLGKPRIVLTSELTGLFTTMVLLYVLLTPFQIIGAAIASLVSYFIISIVLVRFISQQTGIGIFCMLLPRRSDWQFLISKFR